VVEFEVGVGCGARRCCGHHIDLHGVRVGLVGVCDAEHPVGRDGGPGRGHAARRRVRDDKSIGPLFLAVIVVVQRESTVTSERQRKREARQIELHWRLGIARVRTSGELRVVGCARGAAIGEQNGALKLALSLRHARQLCGKDFAKVHACADAAQKVIAADGRVLSDSLWISDEQAYDNGWLNMASGLGVWGIIFDVQVCDDFLILEEETAIGTVVADFVTRYGRPPADGVWVQFYQADCEPPLLDAPTPGRAGEVTEWRVSKLRPMDVVHFVYGFADGAFRVPGCGSVNISIARPVYMGRAVADRDGKATFSAFVSEQARGRTVLFQALQRTTCSPGNVLRHTFE